MTLRALFRQLFSPSAKRLFEQARAAYEHDDFLSAYKATQRILNLHPQDSKALHLHGICLLGMSKPAQAYQFLKQAATLQAADSNVWIHAAHAAKQSGNLLDTIDCYQHSLDISPNQPEILNNMGLLYQRIGRREAALKCIQKSLELCPTAVFYNNLGGIYTGIGKIKEAAAAFTKALEIDPSFIDARCGLINATSCISSPSGLARMYSLLVDFNKHVTERIAPLQDAWTMPINPQRKLKIAYLSSDFRNHPVGFNMLPIIEHHDRARYETHFFSDTAKPDTVTKLFMHLADEWHDVRGLDDELVARSIRAAQIDILIILAWRFDRNRPLVAAYRAAPVQVSYHDPGSSGASYMDFLITDITLTPIHSPEWYAERVVRLPTYYVHKPIENAPAVSPLPAVRNGFITFGCFNNPSKLTDEVLYIWGQILMGTPNSRIYLKYNTVYEDALVRQRIQQELLNAGSSKNQIFFGTGNHSRESHLQQYHLVDIALDPFPFSGSTTTFEALWMGVPVITYAGQTMVSRWSASMLRRLDLSSLIASSPEEYVSIASELVKDSTRLTTLRSELRGCVLHSPLCNGMMRTRHLERAYRYMWRRFCSGQ